jgi:hypothetical protein
MSARIVTSVGTRRRSVQCVGKLACRAVRLCLSVRRLFASHLFVEHTMFLDLDRSTITHAAFVTPPDACYLPAGHCIILITHRAPDVVTGLLFDYCIMVTRSIGRLVR